MLGPANAPSHRGSPPDFVGLSEGNRAGPGHGRLLGLPPEQPADDGAGASAGSEELREKPPEDGLQTDVTAVIACAMS